MSRSEKRTPIVKDRSRNKQRFLKRQASKAARRVDLSDGCAYKKVYNTYKLSDWRTSLWRYVKRNKHPDLTILRMFWSK